MVLLSCTLSVITLVALVLILPSVQASSVQPPCYFPNGYLATDDTIPCPKSKNCCPTDAYCLSNGLCWRANKLLRWSCSDPSWASPDCSRFCRTSNSDQGKVMTPCNNSGLYACNYGSCGNWNFSVEDGDVILQDYQQTSLGALVTVTKMTSVFNSIPTSTSNPTATSSLLAKENSSSAPFDQSSKLAGVGAGIGAPFAIALAVALALLGRERRKARRLELENARLGGGGGGGGRRPRKPTTHYPHPAQRGFADGHMVGNAGLAENEVMTQPIAHELQAPIAHELRAPIGHELQAHP